MEFAPIPFDEIKHGLEVLREAANLEDEEHVLHCLRLLEQRTNQAKGGAAEAWLDSLSWYLEYPGDVTDFVVDELREAIRDLAFCYATTHETEEERRRLANAKGGRKKNASLPDWMEPIFANAHLELELDGDVHIGWKDLLSMAKSIAGPDHPDRETLNKYRAQQYLKLRKQLAG